MNKIHFVNQSSGSLFTNLAKDVSTAVGEAVLLLGETNKGQVAIDNNLMLLSLQSYNRNGIISRVKSGLLFVLMSCRIIVRDKPRVLLAVSNPPFLSIVMYILSKAINLKYLLLVYDIYPDILVGTGVVTRYHPLVKIWRWLNRIVYENSAGVITIGDSMRDVLEGQFDSTKTELRNVQVIHNCADEKVFKPLVKQQNKLEEHRIDSGLKIVYSGNFGFTHDFDTILDVAKKVRNKNHRFILVGEGAKKRSVNHRIQSEKITNVISRNFYSESDFPRFISTADIALITMSRGCEDLMVPSKIYISMAVGSAIIGIVSEKSEVAHLIRKHKCGVVVPAGDSATLLNVIEKFSSDKRYLEECKENSFKAFNQNYTRDHTSSNYIKVFNRILD